MWLLMPGQIAKNRNSGVIVVSQSLWRECFDWCACKLFDMSLLSPAAGQGASLLGGASGGSLLGGTATTIATSGSLLSGNAAPSGGSLLSASAPAPAPTSSALGTANSAQQLAAPAVNPAAAPINYDKYSLDDILSHKLLQAVAAFRRDPSVTRRGQLEASISANKHRLRDPQWLPPLDADALKAVQSRIAQSKREVDAALGLSEITGVNQFVSYLLVQHAAKPGSEVPDTREYCMWLSF